MLFILTYFHVYWRIIVLKGIYMKHMEMESKCATRKVQNKQIKRKPKQTYKFGPSTDIGII
jgi:hypothetical protein